MSGNYRFSGIRLFSVNTQLDLYLKIPIFKHIDKILKAIGRK
jgi:hypothetical protein